MNKRTIFFIVAAVVLVGGAITAYFLFFRDDTPDAAPPGKPTLNPNAQPVHIPGKGSTLITSGATGVTGAGFAGMNESNLNSYNVLTDPGTNPQKIHFTAPFNKACDPWVWYNKWLYAYVESTQDANTGLRTCYYEVSKSKLPAELAVQTPAAGACANFKLYLSGIEYAYDSIRNVKIGIVTIPYCIYKR